MGEFETYILESAPGQPQHQGLGKPHKLVTAYAEDAVENIDLRVQDPSITVQPQLLFTAAHRQ
jgi:hypothetical protein